MLPRATLIHAVEAGISASNLSWDHIQRLMLVARTTPKVGPSWSSKPGCPATQAGLSVYDHAVRDFAFAYDDWLIANARGFEFGYHSIED